MTPRHLAGPILHLVARTRFAALALAAAVFLASSLATRLALLALHPPDDGAAAVLRALAAGEGYDLLAALWLVAPLALLLTLLPERWLRARPVRAMLGVGQLVAIAVAIFVVAAELLFFDEFNGRFNFVAVDYLIYPTEVTTNLWESYPLGWLLGGIAAAAALIFRMLRGRLAGALAAGATRWERLAAGAGYAALLAALTAVVTPRLARVSDDRALNEIASNGYYTFWQALLGQDAPYEGLYATRPDSAVFARLSTLLREPGAPTPRLDAGSTAREVRAASPERRLNVVVVLEESLGSEFIGALHPRDTTLTPRYDSLASEGILLTRAYSTGNRTIRALEATTSSLPPLPGVSIVRRPASEALFTLPSVLRSRGYATEFIYGGRALFDGMERYMLRNGMERVVEQRDMPAAAFTTAWGASDEYIFDAALARLDSLHSAGRPFYTLILTVSNHKPYTYPAGRIAADPNGRHRENAVQYADWALGRFMRMARTHAFFDSTLFVLMGDHGARVYGAAEIPLASYEVPILFYAPALLRPGRVSTLASSLDVPPTVLSLLGISYSSKFFGHDVLHAAPAEGRALMTHNSEIALMRGSLVAVLGPRESAMLFRYDSAARTLRPVSSPDTEGRALIEDAIAYYDGADRVYRSGAYRFEPRTAMAGSRDEGRGARGERRGAVGP
ncbi:MAG TPA: LTA synthase family protein [Gemmatimonadaceae bacterium]|nr:LTA synthase family protein [Gemmatimonadaceae bacterium]